MKSAKKKAGYGAKDLREVSDNPELTKVDFAKARPFGEVFPDLAASIRRGRGPSKSPAPVAEAASPRKTSSLMFRANKGKRTATVLYPSRLPRRQVQPLRAHLGKQESE